MSIGFLGNIPGHNSSGWTVASGSANAIKLGPVPASPPVLSYFAGQTLLFIATSTNTGAATVELVDSALLPVGLLRADGSTLSPGDIESGTLQTIVFDGADFRLACCHGATSGTLNYWGDGSDGALSTTSSINLTSTTDGDVVVKNYTDLTINSGHSVTMSNRCRGLIVYVSGNCIIGGTLSMTGRGASADPTTAGSSDGHAVNAGGVTFWRRTPTGSASYVANGTYGCGNAAVAAEANQVNSAGGATLFTIARSGAAGAAGQTTAANGIAGSNGTAGQSGGGGSGAGGPVSSSNAGTAGTCFSGGTGSNGVNDTPTQTAPGVNGGQGGSITNSASSYDLAGGGQGNPVGTSFVGSSTSGSVSSPQSGTGGFLVLLVKGSLAIGSSGIISSDGCQAPDCTMSAPGTNVPGGGSGGGSVLVLHGGPLSNAGSIRANGGAGGSSSGGSVNRSGGAGGNGSVQGPTQISV